MAAGNMFDRATLIEAFEAIAGAAIANETRLELIVYGGSALMLASNFRFATEDVDIAEIVTPWPAWLETVVATMASRHGWSSDWLNAAVTFHLSPLADRTADHLEFGSFAKNGEIGLDVVVPTADYLLALKLKAIRILDPVKGAQEADDIRNLMRAGRLDIEGAMAVLAKYFPKTAEDGAKQRFLLKRLMTMPATEDDNAPRYGR